MYDGNNFLTRLTCVLFITFIQCSEIEIKEVCINLWEHVERIVYATSLNANDMKLENLSTLTHFYLYYKYFCDTYIKIYYLTVHFNFQL